MSGWIGRTDALDRLGVRAQTLYAYVSRGLIGAQADPDDPRRSLYASADIDRLAARRRRGRKADAIAASAIAWGEPSLPTSISTIDRGQLIYRGVDAVMLSASASLEEVAALLWMLPSPPSFAGPPSPRRFADPLEGVADLARSGPASLNRTAPQLGVDGAAAVARIAAGFALPVTDDPMHERVAAHWGISGASIDTLRRAMVLMADHELNASTFAVRVAASTGASIAAALLAGLATLSGPRHGGAGAALAILVQMAERQGAEPALRGWLASGHALPGFGHPLYPQGDVRALALLAGVEPDPIMIGLRDAVAEATGQLPNIDFALAAMTRTLGLPADAPFLIFAQARSVGWVAHAIEQVTAGSLIRPRGRYEGSLPRTD